MKSFTTLVAATAISSYTFEAEAKSSSPSISGTFGCSSSTDSADLWGVTDENWQDLGLECVARATQLNQIGIYNSNFSMIPTNLLQNATTLSYMYLSNLPNLEIMPDFGTMFEHLTSSPKYMSMELVGIKKLDKSKWGNFTGLEAFSITKAKFTEIDDGFFANHSLSSLYFTQNKQLATALSNNPGWKQGLDQIQEIYFADSDFSDIELWDQMWQGDLNWTKFEFLKIKKSLQKTHMPLGMFRHSVFSTLTQLAIANQQIAEIPAGAFQGLDSINNIGLGSTESLRFIDPDAFQGLSTLTKVAIYDTLVEAIHRDTFRDAWDSLEEIEGGTEALRVIPPGTFRDGVSIYLSDESLLMCHANHSDINQDDDLVFCQECTNPDEYASYNNNQFSCQPCPLGMQTYHSWSIACSVRKCKAGFELTWDFRECVDEDGKLFVQADSAASQNNALMLILFMVAAVMY